jgi:polyhydroxybutyrate depolymerase
MVRIAVKKYLIIAIIAAVSLSCNSRRSLEADGLHLLEMEHGGETRSCLVHVPKNRVAAPSPLIIVLHGGGGTAKGIVKLTKQRYNELADRDGFYVAYPSGLGKSWNDFRDDSDAYAHRHAVDDVGFIAVLIDRLAAEYPIDRGRIFATGISNGGLMSYRLACSLPAIRGIAAVAATHPAGQEGKCAPSRPMNVMIINGTDDPIIPYGGGDIKLLGIKRGRVVPTDATLKYWVRFNKCRGNGNEELLPDTDPGDKTRAKKISYTDCDGGTRVVLFRVEGGGHTWPGGWHYIFSSIIGYTSRDFNACDEIWNFFKAVR